MYIKACPSVSVTPVFVKPKVQSFTLQTPVEDEKELGGGGDILLLHTYIEKSCSAGLGLLFQGDLLYMVLAGVWEPGPLEGLPIRSGSILKLWFNCVSIVQAIWLKITFLPCRKEFRLLGCTTQECLCGQAVNLGTISLVCFPG